MFLYSQRSYGYGALRLGRWMTMKALATGVSAMARVGDAQVLPWTLGAVCVRMHKKEKA